MKTFFISTPDSFVSEANKDSLAINVIRKAYFILSYPIKFYRARRDIAMLAGMDDHQLRDIGLTRMDIANAASLPVERSPTEALAQWVDERRRLRPRR